MTMDDSDQRMRTGSVLAEIRAERERQQREVHGARAGAMRVQAWTLEHDDMHSVNDWAALITRYNGRALDVADALDPIEYRRSLIKIAAIVVAAIESLERVAERHVR